MAECGACLLSGMRPLADPQLPTEIECFELVGLDLMIETSLSASGSPGIRVWLLELNSFPAAAPFHQTHGKSATFHREQVGFCASLLSVVLSSRGQLLGGELGSAEEIAKWRVVAGDLGLDPE